MNKNALFYQLRLDEVTGYIRRSGWKKEDHPNKNLLVYTSSQKDDNGNDIELVLPNGNDFSDAEEKISSVVQLLSSIENLPLNELIQKIKNRNIDVLKQRIYNNTSITNLPLELAPSVIQSLRDLVYQSACVEENPQPYFDKSGKIGKEFTQKCRFGHTFQGSFGMSIEMPIPPNSNDSLSLEFEPTPLERRIMERIYRGLQLSVQAVNEGDVGILTKEFQKGFNANLCEVMVKLTKELEEFNLEYTMLWSSEFTPNIESNFNKRIRIEPKTYRPFFESAAKSLRSTNESVQTKVIGKITNLRAESIDNEIESKSDDRQITISCEMDSGRKMNIKVSLSPDEYRIACDAHKESKRVTIQGKPEKQGKFWILTVPSEFDLAE